MLPFHPYADLLPLIEGAEFEELVADVKANDIRERIDVWDGAILDGRNRYRAALAAGLIDDDDGPDRTKYFRRFVPSVDGDPLKYVVSKNIKRRHLNESQRAMYAARLANVRQGERTDLPGAEPSANLPKVDQPAAAKALSISERALRMARRVQDSGVPELSRAVERGHLAVSVAEKATKLAPEIQRRIASEAEGGDTRLARNAVKQGARAERESVLAEKQRALPSKRYGLIYADIPRHFRVHSDETGMDRSPENHYPTMTFQQLIDLPVQDIAAEDCILVFWSTAASLIDDLDIMAEWGFVTMRPREAGRLRRDVLVDGQWHVADLPTQQAYRSMQVWDKIKIALGYWFRDRHEFILIGARGNVVAPAPGTQDHSLFSEARGEHSAKPHSVAKMLHRLWPNIPKLEMFAREAHEGFELWGKEAPAMVGEFIADYSALTPDEIAAEPPGVAELLSYSTPVSEIEITTPVAEEPPANIPAESGNLLPKLESSNPIPVDDGLDLPQFLVRIPVESAPPRKAQLVSGETGG